MARPSKLTPETSDRILTMLRAGSHIGDACGAAGIDDSTYGRWLERGRCASSGIYRDFLLSARKAQSEANVRCVVQISNAAQKNWKAAAWLLARRDPDHWGAQRTVKVQVQRDVEQMLEGLRGRVDIDAYSQVVRVFAELAGVEGVGSEGTEIAREHPTH